MSAIRVRRMRFAFPATVDPVFVAGDPEFSFVAAGLSLALPYLEPYLVRTMRQAEPLVRDATLRRQLRGFVLQEGQHYQQHKRFNDALRASGLARLAPLEDAIAADYERFSREEPLSFNLAYAEGFEAFTTSMAARFLELDRSAWEPRVLELFEWHLVEELEHRCVAFDVYEALSGDYWNRVRVATFAQRHLARFLWRATRLLVQACASRIEALGGARAHLVRSADLFARFFAPILPRVAGTHLPWYTPRRARLPAAFDALAARYTARAERVYDVTLGA